MKAKGIDVEPQWANGAKVLFDGVTAEALEYHGVPCHTLRGDSGVAGDRKDIVFN